jgi:class 3 adenylate cyclase/predicted ATPase
MDLETWLRSLGLEQYEAAFRDNEIDASVLPNLTADDLKDLGVTIVGHRRKLLDAIAAMHGPGLSSAPGAAAEAPADAAKDTAERRQVTVLFSDLVGSTALSARMDPEDLRDVIAAYQKCVAETVQRFGGFVAKYLGDGVLVYFGYPRAHEDDAERAVRAGLEITAALSTLKTRATLQTRIGIATGMVVVGDLTGSGEAQERGIVGETPNLAARLQGIAAPNTVVIADGTRRLLGNLFELEDLGATELKGINGAVRAFAALRASSAESRFEAMHAAGLIELVGREEEFELLRRRWARAKAGDGQVVLLSGEAGIGKSRLTAALFEQLAGERHIRLRHFCSPQHTDSPLYPTITQLERAAGLGREDAAQVKLDKLDVLLKQSETSAQDAALFAELLSLPNDGRHPDMQLTAEQRRQRTLEALVQQMAAFARENPVLIVVEDAHWTDPTSLELYGRAVDRIASLCALLIVTFRPEFAPPWIGRSHVTTVTLNRLEKRDASAMIDRVVGNKLIPASVRADIIERTDGIPLFVEEMTKAVLEAESEGEAQWTVATIPSSALAVPASLHASLMARLDRLGPAKEVAQVGAAIGREFSHALLAAVMHKPDAELDATIDRLLAAGLLFRQGVPPHASYLFKHALVQDAAYGTLLREPRRTLHARIAEALETNFPDIAESQPELLARHFTEARLIEKAAALWAKAGQRSLERSALVEAVEQLSRALDQTASLPMTPALRRERIRLQVALIAPLIHVKGYAAPETKGAVERARALIDEANALGEPLEDPLLLYQVLYGFWVANVVHFNGDVCRDLATQFLALAKEQGETTPHMVGHRLLAFSLSFRGDLPQSREHYEQSMALYDPVKHRPLALRFGQDARVGILSLRSLTNWVMGYQHAALADAEYALKDAREIGQAGTLMYALHFVSLIYVFSGNNGPAQALIDELVTLAEEKAAIWKALGMMNQGCLDLMTGKAAEAVRLIDAGMTGWRSTGATLLLPTYLSYLMQAYADVGSFDDAARCRDEALKAVETTKEKWWEAELNRMAGEIVLKSPQPDMAEAQAYFERAFEIASKQQAKTLQLRAAMSMARPRRGQRKRKGTEARDRLAAVYGSFTEGLDMPDLKEAKALLEALT